ncbi:hypothetical protein [Spiroplasma melliferum]|uniref:hypothetical protein n=1 Tax=Spiroplasma melliferum TaxID=2134 RepID=UPI0002A654CD|nr:hypothetical protein [Spiroplasma melliferum]ELL44127.1 hypothetical protein SMIPMB4A_v3c9510 [Spiroplasma melliferum IPMB4A]
MKQNNDFSEDKTNEDKNDKNDKKKQDETNSENEDLLKNDFLDDFRKYFNEIKGEPGVNSKIDSYNRLEKIPLPKIEKTKGWLELTNHHLSPASYNKIHPEKIGAGSSLHLITEKMNETVHRLSHFSKATACILVPFDQVGLIRGSSAGIGLGNTFLSGSSNSKVTIYRRMNESSFDLKQGELRKGSTKWKINRNVIKEAIMKLDQKLNNPQVTKDLFKIFKMDAPSSVPDVFFAPVPSKKDVLISYGPKDYPMLFEIKFPLVSSKMYLVDLNKYGGTLAVLIKQGYKFKYTGFTIIPERNWEIIKVKITLVKH